MADTSTASAVPKCADVLRVQRQGRTVVGQVIGRATMRQCPAFRQYVEDCLADGPKVVQLELRDCTYMDSTFLGTLVFLKRAVDRQGGSRLVLVSPSAECDRLLQQMKLNDVLPIAQTGPAEPSERWTDLGSETDGFAFQQGVVEAHQQLAELSGPAGDTFRSLAKELTDEWKALQRRREDGERREEERPG